MLDYKVGSSLKNIVVKGAPSRTERPCSWFHYRPFPLIAGFDPRFPAASVFAILSEGEESDVLSYYAYFI